MSTTPKVSVIIPAYNAASSIVKTLDAVKNQTLTSLECIIVNDGSKDDTHQVVSDYIEKTRDQRFILIDQENTGVGGARNKGIENAKGKYIAFYDADDDVPADALSNLVSVADEKRADLVIGNMWFSNMTERHQTKALQRLTSHKRIHPFDEDIIKTGSPCNKLFSREIMMRYNIRFSNLRRAEDLLFCIEFEGKCSLIAPCESIVYTYERRPFWEESSLTQNNDMQTYKDVIESQDACLRAITENYEFISKKIGQEDSIAQAELKNQYDKLKSKMYCRFVKTNFHDEIYRFAWVTDSEVLDNIHDRIEECRKHVFPYDWETEITNTSSGLILENDNVVSKEKIAASPLMTFAVSGITEESDLNLLLKGIYRQNFPAFEILIQEKLFDLLDETWKTMENIRVVGADDHSFRDKALRDCRGKYIWFIDRLVYISRTLVRSLYNFAEKNPARLFMSIPLYKRQADEYKRIDANATSFTSELGRQKRRTEYNQLDYFWCNKIFTTRKLRSLKNPFAQSDWETLDRFYSNSSYYKLDRLPLVTDLDDADVLNRVKSKKVKLTWRKKLEEEDDFQHKIDNRYERVLTRAERKKMRRRKNKKDFFRWVTVKLIYPVIYAFYRHKQVDPNKVLFVEPTQLKPTNSMKGMIRAVKKDKNVKIIQMSLGHNKVRKKEQLKREIAFLKEFATARYVFTTEALATIGGFTKKKETTVVQLWHGCGAFKRFGFSTADYKFGGSLESKVKYPDYRNADLVTVSSPEVIWAYEEAMDYKGAGVVQATGISRTDIFYDDNYLAEARQRVFNAIPEAKGKKVILYAPTFRGRVRKAKAPDRLNIKAMCKALGDDYYLLIKHHPHCRNLPPVPDECRGFAKDVTESMTIDDLICCADICISDYSSLIFEYSLFEKPMIFFAYDLEDYNDWRGFYYDYDELTPGPVVSTTKEIINYIKDVDAQFDAEEVKEFREKFMSACDGHATERILKQIGMF